MQLLFHHPPPLAAAPAPPVSAIFLELLVLRSNDFLFEELGEAFLVTTKPRCPS